MSVPESQPNSPREDDRRLAQHDSIPVRIESEMDQATPADWDWRIIGASQPNAAVFHINHSDVTQVKVDALGPEDSPPDAPFVITGSIPILVIDTLDQYWAGNRAPGCPCRACGCRWREIRSRKRGRSWRPTWQPSCGCSSCCRRPARATSRRS